MLDNTPIVEEIVLTKSFTDLANKVFKNKPKQKKEFYSSLSDFISRVTTDLNASPGHFLFQGSKGAHSHEFLGSADSSTQRLIGNSFRGKTYILSDFRLVHGEVDTGAKNDTFANPELESKKPGAIRLNVSKIGRSKESILAAIEVELDGLNTCAKMADVFDSEYGKKTECVFTLVIESDNPSIPNVNVRYPPPKGQDSVITVKQMTEAFDSALSLGDPDVIAEFGFSFRNLDGKLATAEMTSTVFENTEGWEQKMVADLQSCYAFGYIPVPETSSIGVTPDTLMSPDALSQKRDACYYGIEPATIDTKKPSVGD